MVYDKNSLRVMHVITGLLGGGAERFTIDLAKAQITSGKQIRIVSLGDETQTLVSEVKASDISMELLSMNRNPLMLSASVRKLRNTIRNFAPDVIHCHMFHPMILVLMAVTGMRVKPYIVFTPHSFNIGSRLREFIAYLTRSQRNADVLFSKNMMRSFYRKDATCIPNGINMMPVRDIPKNQRFTFINVAGLRPEKNQIVILDAVKRLRDNDITDFDVWIAGDGPLKDILIQYKNKHDLDNVHFLGFRKDVGLLLQQSHCFILPSLWEGLPLSVLEAASFALPVICTRVGGLEEYFNEDDLTYTGKDAQQVAAAMSTIRKFPTKYWQKADILQKRVRNNFSIQAVENEYEKVYNGLF